MWTPTTTYSKLGRRSHSSLSLICGFAASCCLSSLSAHGAEGSLKRLYVEPAAVELRATNRMQQVLVTAESTSGDLIDVTHAAQLRIRDSQFARMRERV